jgi:hypothetical protein
MMPVSGRIPEDLYQWLSTTTFEGATTMSDKLRVAMTTLKRLQDGDNDYNGALDMHRDMCKGLRQQLAKLEPELGHSEVLAALMEHVPAMSATLTSAQASTAVDAKRIEAVLVQRCFLLVESLLRQAVTQKARAYDTQVISKHSAPLIELGTIIQRSSLDNKEGN